jgi:general secretion pathway protein B
MSYILEALKRADRERTRGAPPDIHAATLPTIGDESSRRPGLWPWVVGALAVGLVALLLWRPASAPPEPRATTTAAPTAPRVSEAAPAEAPRPAAAPTTAALPAPPFLPKPKRARSDIPAAEEQTTATTATSASDATPATPVGVSADLKVVARQDLPADVRQQLPALKLGGLVYSSQASKRLLIVDGQVLREGESAGAGVVLEQIQPRSAVFRFMRYRFEQSL